MPYIDAVDKYLAVLGRMLKILSGGANNCNSNQVNSSFGLGLDWLDMDLAVSAYCDSEGLAVPSDTDMKMEIHIRALESALSDLRKGG